MAMFRHIDSYQNQFIFVMLTKVIVAFSFWV
ncbi:hypothetical protein HNQ38_001772 [Desulfovibrio intestinalis]|uniref:Uncharacterized protein n=1 Tax=Desulfovibrio intestinalis TaxID=58621 RepID=A0A7W8FHB1_9BACT|nr:hypothetical protein [Desulfovibrio intestinalis]